MKLSDSEKLLVYYGMILYLLRDDENAIKLKEKYSESVKGNALFYGNIYRVLGLIYFRKLDIKEALESFKKAYEQFDSCRCLYGKALTKYSIGVIYRSNYSELLIDSKSSLHASESPHDTTKRALINFTIALNCFKQLNHIVGQARCHEHMA